MFDPGSGFTPDGRYIRQQKAPLPRGPEHHLLHIPRKDKLRDRPDPVIPPAHAYAPRGYVHVRRLQSPDHVGQGEIEGGQLLGRNDDVQLLLRPPAHEQVGHFRDPLQILTDILLEEGPVRVDRVGIPLV
jgi:hypothetical protein